MPVNRRAALCCAFLLNCIAAPAYAQESDTSSSADAVPPVEVIQAPATPRRSTTVKRKTTAASRPTPVQTSTVPVAPLSTSPSFEEATAISRPATISSKVPNLTTQQAVTSDTAQMMSPLPGASIYSAGGVSGLPVLNGLAADRLNSQVGGMSLVAACANQMNPPLSYIAPSQVGSMTVYPNLVPVSVGGDSIGGTILVDRAAPVFAATGQKIFSGEIGSYYRSNGDAFGGNAIATAAVRNVSVTYSGAYAQSGNYTAGHGFKPAGPAFPSVSNHPVKAPFLDADEVGSTAYQAQNHDIAIAARDENHLLQFDLGIQHIPFQNYPNQRMDMTDNESVFGNLRYTGDFDWGVLEAQLYRQNVEHEMNFGDDKQFYYQSEMGLVSPGMPMDTEARDTGGKLKASIDVSQRDILRIGGEFQIFHYSDVWPPSPKHLPAGAMAMMAPDTFFSINDGRRDRYDVFAEWEATWTPQWTTELGVRSDTELGRDGRSDL